MKPLLLTTLLLAWAAISPAQNVNIPDANFKAALIANGVDTDHDGEISYTEAETFTSPNDFLNNTLRVYDYDINDLTGIEAFINLWGLCV